MNKIKSPCVGVCKLDPNNPICEGCNRSIDEIRYWSIMTDDEKLKTLERVERRAKGEVVVSDSSEYQLTRQKRQRNS